jgi:hypothetical protein
MATALKYRIVGRRGIGVFQTGQVVDGDDLAGVNIQALLDGGHIVVEPAKIKIESVKEEE